MASDVTTAFLEFSGYKLLDEYWPRLRTSVESLTDEQIWWRPNAASNSAGNLVLHLNGNVRQWLLAPFGDAADERDRPAEFAARGLLSRETLLGALESTMREVARVLPRITEEQLLATHRIQGYSVNGVEAVYQVVEHFALHYGQILYITKLLRGADLGFYGELDATGRIGE